MKTLIVYATKYGSTKKCVDILKSHLNGNIEIATTKSITNRLNLYDNIIVGGPVYMGKIDKSIRKFCKNNRKILLQKRLALFACCYTPSEDIDYLKRLFPIELIEHSTYATTVGGEMNYQKMNFLYRKMFENLKKIDNFNKEFSEPQIRNSDIEKIARAINNI